MRLTARAVFRVMRLVVAVALLAPVTAAVAQTAAGGAGFTIVVKSDGSVWTFGQNNQGQLGDNTTTTRRTPLQVSGLSDIVAVAAGAYHALALESDGTLWAWGDNAFGQLGDTTNTDRKTGSSASGRRPTRPRRRRSAASPPRAPRSGARSTP